MLCSKPCALQNPQDKSFTDGTLYVYQTLARFVSKGGAAQHRVEFPIDDIKGGLHCFRACFSHSALPV